tara:strand:+ start:219 stop:1088 length:870 start_codon:yes stop_codon:yes gene_type:complete
MSNSIFADKDRIILGSANFSLKYGLANNFNKINLKEIKKIIRSCEKNDINFIDTSKGYGDSEKLIGNLKNKKWNIITKIPKIELNKKKDIEIRIFKSIEDSLNNLKVRKLYAVLLHDENQLLCKNAVFVYDILRKLKKNKLVKKIGVSFYSSKKLIKIISAFNIDLVQIPINYINRDFLKNNILKKIKNKKIEIHARSIFLQGLLLKNNIKHKKFIKFYKFLNEWHKINKFSKLETSLNFINSIKYVDKYVLGFENLKQINEILKIQEKKINIFPYYKDNFIKDPRKWK